MVVMVVVYCVKKVETRERKREIEISKVYGWVGLFDGTIGFVIFV